MALANFQRCSLTVPSVRLVGKGEAMKIRLLVNRHDSIFILGGWTELEAAGQDAVFLLPVSLVRVSAGHRELRPIGQPAGDTLEIKVEVVE